MRWQEGWGFFLMDKDLMSLAGTVGIRIISVPFDANDSHSSSFQCGWVSMRWRSSLPENYRKRKWVLHPGHWVKNKDHQPCSRIGLQSTLWLDCVFIFSLILLLGCCLARRFYALEQTMKQISISIVKHSKSSFWPHGRYPQRRKPLSHWCCHCTNCAMENLPDWFILWTWILEVRFQPHSSQARWLKGL